MTRILVVDDESSHREVLVTYLELGGYEVDEAEDGVAALAWMQRVRPDLVLLDLQMPEMDGFAVLRRMREEEGLAAVPVIMLTAMGKGSLKVRGLEMGADDYVMKPFDRVELLARVRARLRAAARETERRVGMRGEIGALRLSDVLQTVDRAGKPARVRLMELGGEVVVVHGRVVAATFGQHRGGGALTRQLLLERGPFQVDFIDVPTEPIGDAPSLQHLLMDSGVEMDEVNQVLGRIGRDDPIVSLRHAGAQGVLSHVAPATPMRLLDLVTGMAGDLRENAKALAAAFDDGHLVIVD